MPNNLIKALEALSLPPAYRLVLTQPDERAHDTACALAGKRGAGTLVVSAHPDLVDCAVVLEPDDPLRTARRVFFAGMVALADAVSVHAPAEKPLQFQWPATLDCDGAMIGGGRLASPPGSEDDKRPDWLVFSIQLCIRHGQRLAPGLHPYTTCLEQEGFEALSAIPYIESFTRHLMTQIDRMQHRNFRLVAESYLERLTSDGRKGQRQLDPFGNLVTRFQPNSKGQMQPLLPLAEKPDWLDDETGMTRL